MLKLLLFCLVGAAFCAPSAENAEEKKTEYKHWALLVAGSSGWYNYRHQSDICHAFQVMQKHGIPKENIIVMMYNDIANNDQNPDKGVMINHPSGKNVYTGVNQDYTGKDVTPQNFLNILSGNKEAMKNIGSGKVVESSPQNRVFVYFSDHGAVGLVAFPHDILKATSLIKTLKSMHDKKKYHQMVIYIEACESGSMFENILPDSWNIYATTASSASESSYACYYDSHLKAYLGDEYSVRWMEDSDYEDTTKETLEQQEQLVTKETLKSHVHQYGDLTMNKLTVADFQGDQNSNKPKQEKPPMTPCGGAASRDVPLQIIYKRMSALAKESRIQLTPEMEAEATVLKDELAEITKERKKIDNTMRAIAGLMAKNPGQFEQIVNGKYALGADRECYESILDTFDEHCFRLCEHDYAMGKLQMFANACHLGVTPNTIIKSIRSICQG